MPRPLRDHIAVQIECQFDGCALAAAFDVLGGFDEFGEIAAALQETGEPAGERGGETLMRRSESNSKRPNKAMAPAQFRAGCQGWGLELPANCRRRR